MKRMAALTWLRISSSAWSNWRLTALTATATWEVSMSEQGKYAEAIDLVGTLHQDPAHVVGAEQFGRGVLLPTPICGKRPALTIWPRN